MDLLTRLFLNWRTSLDGAFYAIIAWLLSHGIALSDVWTARAAALAALISGAVWKLFSKDPEPPRQAA